MSADFSRVSRHLAENLEKHADRDGLTGVRRAVFLDRGGHAPDEVCPSVERVTLPRHLTEQARGEWAAWLERHGIDPKVVALPGWVEWRPVSGVLAYLAYVLDDQGRVQLDPADRDAARRTVRTVRFEQEPTFPDVDSSTRRDSEDGT